MAKVLEIIPLINLFDWADGDKYTTLDDDIDFTTLDDNIELTTELEKSYKETEEKAKEYFKPSISRVNSEKGKLKVEKKKINTNTISKQEQESNRGERDR